MKTTDQTTSLGMREFSTTHKNEARKLGDFKRLPVQVLISRGIAGKCTGQAAATGMRGRTPKREEGTKVAPSPKWLYWDLEEMKK